MMVPKPWPCLHPSTSRQIQVCPREERCLVSISPPREARVEWTKGKGGTRGRDGGRTQTPPAQAPCSTPAPLGCQCRLLPAAMQRPWGASEWVSVSRSPEKDALGRVPHHASWAGQCQLPRPCQSLPLLCPSRWAQGIPQPPERSWSSEVGQEADLPATSPEAWLALPAPTPSPS